MKLLYALTALAATMLRDANAQETLTHLRHHAVSDLPHNMVPMEKDTLDKKLGPAEHHDLLRRGLGHKEPSDAWDASFLVNVAKADGLKNLLDPLNHEISRRLELSCDDFGDGSLICFLEDYPFDGYLLVYLGCPPTMESASECDRCAILKLSDPLTINLTDVQCFSCSICDSGATYLAGYDCTNAIMEGDEEEACAINSCDEGCSTAPDPSDRVEPDPDCVDSPAVWLVLCEWFNEDPERCDAFGDVFKNEGYSATQACCACGGGLQYGLQPSCHRDDPDSFNICLDLGSPSGQYEGWMGTVALAQHFWERVLYADIGPAWNTFDLPTSVEFEDGEILYTTNEGYPAMLDDSYIAMSGAEIDGEGEVAGYGGPLFVRSDDEYLNPLTGEPYVFTLTGFIEFDVADVELLAQEGILRDTIMHEMGHVLGYGTFWEYNGLYAGDGAGVYTSGTKAEREWRALGCSGPLPVELDWGEGTANSHWDEECLTHELMTGITYGSELGRLSRISIASFEDLGYKVDYSQAEFYSIADLGECGSFCPESNFTSTGRRLEKTPSRALREVDRAKVLAYAKPKLEALRMYQSELPEGVIYVGGQTMDVIYRDEDGTIHFVLVKADDIGGV